MALGNEMRRHRTVLCSHPSPPPYPATISRAVRDQQLQFSPLRPVCSDMLQLESTPFQLPLSSCCHNKSHPQAPPPTLHSIASPRPRFWESLLRVRSQDRLAPRATTYTIGQSRSRLRSLQWRTPGNDKLRCGGNPKSKIECTPRRAGGRSISQSAAFQFRYHHTCSWTFLGFDGKCGFTAVPSAPMALAEECVLLAEEAPLVRRINQC